MRRRGASVLANPVLVGAVTVLVVIVAVYLAYNANNGLPFVPTYELNVKAPNAGKLVEGNDVREGGFRIGVVDRISGTRLSDGTAGAVLTLKLDKDAGPVPDDTTVKIRPRSALGLKYVELTRGHSRRELANGSTIVVGPNANTVELEDFFGIFDRPTRVDAERNLAEFGSAFAARGVDLNLTLSRTPRLLEVLDPVAANLADPSTRLGFFVHELADAARVTSPVADSLAEQFSSGAAVFEAFSRYPDRLAQTIAKSPSTLEVGTASLVAQRPFLRHLAELSPDLRGSARQLRTSLPVVNTALDAGRRILPRAPQFNARLNTTLATLDVLVNDPSTNQALEALTDTVTTLNPMLRYLGPYVTVCNYWNYWWTYLADHLTDQDSTGQVERIEAKTAGAQQDALGSFGADNFANSQGYIGPPALGDPADLHVQQYGAAITRSGKADCESGQRGYPRRLAKYADPSYNVVLDPRTPGAQGPTFTGRSEVPHGETFDSFPDARTKVGAR
jgi:phospholipid/cholesterol/gamma-HCH transport system substrate-binding protein